MLSNPKQLSCKKVCGPEKGHCEKRCDNSGEFVLPSLRFTRICLNCCHLKFCHKPTITTISWLPPWISHLFSLNLLRAAHFFLQLGCFGLDFTSFCNCTLCSKHTAIIKYLLLFVVSFCKYQVDVLMQLSTG